MRLSLNILTLAWTVTNVFSFSVIPLLAKRESIGSALESSSDMTDAEAQMEVMPKIWDELRKSERDIVIKHNLDEIDEMEASSALVEKMLETAMDFLKTKEQIEEEHAFAAHVAYQHAAEEEVILEESIIDENLKDIPLDSSVKERLDAALEKEAKALKDEDDALKALAKLYHKEDALNATLEELKKLKP
jgi:hypothetical protein